MTTESRRKFEVTQQTESISAECAQQLANQERRHEWFEWLAIGAFVLAVVAIAAFVYGQFEMQYPWPLKTFLSLVAGLFGGYPILLILKPLVGTINERFAPSWVIEECEAVIKVHGFVSLTRWSDTQARMLERRPGYMPVEKAWEKYGCTMAAVPASSGYLTAKKQLASLGFSH